MVIKWYKVTLTYHQTLPKLQDKKLEALFNLINKPWTNLNNSKSEKRMPLIMNSLIWLKISSSKSNVLKISDRPSFFWNKKNNKPSNDKTIKLQKSSTIKWKKWEIKISGALNKPTNHLEILLSSIKNKQPNINTTISKNNNQSHPWQITNNAQNNYNKKVLLKRSLKWRITLASKGLLKKWMILKIDPWTMVETNLTNRLVWKIDLWTLREIKDRANTKMKRYKGRVEVVKWSP